MGELTTAQFEAAKARGEARLRGPRAETAHYDALRDRVVIRLVSGVEIGFAPADAEGLERASAEDLQEIEVEAFGLGIHFPRLDADLYVPALPRGLLGSRKWMAARRAAAGGHNRGTAGSATSREHGGRAKQPRLAKAEP